VLCELSLQIYEWGSGTGSKEDSIWDKLIISDKIGNEFIGNGIVGEIT